MIKNLWSAAKDFPGLCFAGTVAALSSVMCLLIGENIGAAVLSALAGFVAGAIVSWAILAEAYKGKEASK